MLQSIKERADRVIQNLEERKITGIAAMDELEALAEEKDEAKRGAKSGLTELGFGVYWVLSAGRRRRWSGLSDAWQPRGEIEIACSTKFPNWRENPDEQRRLRGQPLQAAAGVSRKDDAPPIIEHVMQVLEQAAWHEPAVALPRAAATRRAMAWAVKLKVNPSRS